MADQNQTAKSSTPASEYLKSDELGLVIAKGMAVMYKTNPKNPVDFLAKWLLNYAQVQKAALSQEEDNKNVGEKRKHHEAYMQEEENKALQAKVEQDARQKKIDDFIEMIKASPDLNDNLQDLADHLKEFTSGTAVYIGKLIQPTKPIEEGSDDTAHLDPDAEQILRFCNANQQHQFLVDKTLSAKEGLTFDVFKDPEAEAEAEAEAAPEEGEEGAEAVEQEAKEILPRHIVVPEVVREGRMHYFQVPRLGSYLAIRLEYESCLYEEAYDAGIQDYLSVKERQRNQAEDIKAWEDNQKEQQDEAEAAGETFVPEQKVWDKITPKEFKTKKVQLVVCLNTLGQDREFTEDQTKFALRCVQRYRDEWERIERDALKADIEHRLDQMDFDKNYKELHEALDQTELESKTEAAVAPREGDEPLGEDARQTAQKKARFNMITRTFFAPEEAALHQKQVEREKMRASQGADRVGTPNTSQGGADNQIEEKYYPIAPQQWKKEFLELKDVHVIKHPRVLQTLFFLLRYSRDQFCERDTCKLEFKKAKTLINDDLFTKMGSYNPFGPSELEYLEYQRLAFLRKNIEGMDEEKLDEYSVVIGKIFRWVQSAIELRIEDVIERRNHNELLKKEREDAIAADAERTTKYETAKEEARAAHEARVDEEMAKLDALEEAEGEEGEDAEKPEKEERERPEFDEEDFIATFDEANALIEIPPEVKDDVDNDFDLPYTPPTFTGE